MAPDPSVYEKLGSFYLGKTDDSALLYDSRDLVTHGVCIGMTGSGKTGLCLALLEEAAMDGIPAIIIDPKGDLGNLLLTFPGLKPEDFRPWINEDDAARKGVSPDEWAASQAKTWRDGLASWGQSGERIAKLRETTDFAIYTPGSTAGIPVNLVDIFHAPESTDPEALAEHAQTAVSSFLGLLGLNVDPLKSREGSFLSTLLVTEWTAGRSPDLTDLVGKIQNPPFQKVGLLDLETFFPAKERFAMIMALNSLLASPGFATWQSGEPLDIGRFLRTPEGKPRHAIFSIAHLDDSQRMFFVSLLLNEIVSWMRKQTGTTSLRALVYMDEIFGYFPPISNPPSKLPLLTLLKQARAFGVGVMLSTQNPVDLDYKGLANAGTWFIGRLQTDRDRAKVIECLQNSASPLPKAELDALLSGLGSRRFLLSNVHDPAPVVFESRWVMSYLRGPLTRDQIRTLMQHAPRTATPVEKKSDTIAAALPSVPPGVRQVFRTGSPVLAPRLCAAATIRFADAKRGFDETREILLAAEFPSGVAPVDWENAEEVAGKLGDFTQNPPENASYEALPSSACDAKAYAAWEKDFIRWITTSESAEVLTCPDLKLTASHGESRADFIARVELAHREARDAKTSALRKKYEPKLASLAERLRRAEAGVEKQRQQARDASIQTAVSIGSSILGAFFGRRALSATTINRAGSALRGAGRAAKENQDVAAAQESAEAVRSEQSRLEEELAAEIAAIAAASSPEVVALPVKASRTGTNVRWFGLGWI